MKFPAFFHWNAIYENAYKGLHKSKENHWNTFQNVNLECQSPLSVFSREKVVFDFFWQKSKIIFVTFIHVYRKYHISVYFLRNIILHFPSKEIISYFRVKKKNPFNTRKIIFQWDIFGKTIFQNIWKKKIWFFVQCHELTHELLNDLKLRILGNQEISRKSPNFIELLSSYLSFSRH